MTTIPVSAKMDLRVWGSCDFAGMNETKIAGSEVKVKITRRTACFPSFVVAVSDWLEQGDTFTEKIAGFGLCGITLVYMTGHIVKAVFG